ncbi:hypothetical protein L3Q82_005748 [Scortum barcoo]|uniref:Uncharacterized protein n=1 Tax=Scortum barcoo TaxID=214431 RepID=A0ACB8V692_9TELE|nr:hypothetical protein L3Q82_005748 [Scortum barcoo]
MGILKREGSSLDLRVSILLVCVVAVARGQIRYSIPEEMRKGLFVGDVAKDLGLDVKRLVSGRARLVIDGDNQYVALNQNKGQIVVNERIDREKLCAKKSPCSFSLEIVLEDPLELFSITVEIQDVNDHAPVFPRKEMNLEISESTPTGTVFLLDSAADPDVGVNSLQSYSLKTNDHFVLKQHSRPDGSKYAEMMLQSGLDREKQSEHTLILTAVDGGEPQRSGTVRIHVSVLDANDNAPVFTQSVYKASVLENVPRGAVIARVSAVDADQGYNGNVTYSFTHLEEDSSCPFEINSYTGEVKLIGDIDYEVSPNYEINLQAKDPWGVVGASKLMIEVADVNDNSPIITMASYSGKLSEDSPPGTVVALISVQDKDSGKNGQVNLNIDDNLPFKIKSSLRNYYTLVTEHKLDREKRSRYNITLTATDEGSPALSGRKSVVLDVTDINDNAPAFSQSVYSAQVTENNSPGVTLLQIHATDLDQGHNARISYFLIDGEVNGNPVSAYFSINTESGVIQSLRSLDYEQVKEYKIRVKAQDGGSPPQSSNATVVVRVQDQNDNPPQVLYPVQTGGSLVAEMVPRSADVGYLVTKVVAVDVDSGQNAWLSYKLQKATDRALFEVGSQNGEIRTIRQVTDKDAVKQRLTVIVEDNGQPSRSATVIVNVAVADSFPEVLSEFTDFTHDKEYNDNLTFYLVLALAVVSFLFITCLVVIISVKIYRWRQVSHPVSFQPPCDSILSTTLLRHFGDRDSPTRVQLRAEAQIRYSIPEEMKKGSLVGNVAQDLGLDLNRLRSGRARIVTGENIQYTELKADKGILVVNERIDREELCGDVTPCSFTFEILLEKPMELHPVTIEVLDVNDNAPTFQNSHLEFEISESAALGSRFVLESADDADVGENGLQNYILTPNDNFILKQHVNPDGSKYAEMVLQKSLDREEQPRLSLKLLAVDGGNPQRSGTVYIDVNILDINDNAPVFNQSVYKATVTENAAKGTHIVTVNASDIDSGSNAQVMYSFSKSKAGIADLFDIDEATGRIYVAKEIDFEKDKKIEFRIEAKDQGGLTDSSKVEIEVVDVNDNAPLINVMSFTSPVSEDSPAGTTIGIINVKDLDSGENGQVRCSIEGSVPFKIKSNVRNYYALMTDAALDRESLSECNITVVASDAGSPPLSTKKTFYLKVSDVNDNAPVFQRGVYTAFIAENNSPGVSVLSVNAKDPDENQNARVSYMLEDSEIGGSPVSEYVSINAESGVIHAVRSFDYEQIKQLVFIVKAQDGGSPPLSSNVTVKIMIQDQNDNPPQVLYPVQTGGSVVAEMVPRSADVGYLVTKVVAVDVDSGQNAWLSYKLQKATDRALFEVGSQNGEIRTIRQVTDKDAVKQRLTVIVEDNGQPSRSATVIVNVAVADSFPEVLSEFTDFTHDKEYNDNLTFYLVLALAVVSFLFITCLVVIISVKIYRWRQSRILYQSNLPVIPYYPPRYSDTLGTGTLQHVYNYEVCRTTDSRKSDCKFGRAGSQNVLIMDPSSTGTMQRIQSEKSILDEPDSPLEIRYSIPEEMRKGSVIGNVAQDLGLDLKRLRSGRARIVTGENIHYTELKADKGILVVNERIDREELCGDVTPCSFSFEIDYEKDRKYEVRVEAKDQGGLTGTSKVIFEVVDVNDNAPDQNDNPPQVLYPVQTGGSLVAEMVPRSADVGYLVTKVVAVDVDSGQNAWLSYKLQKATDRALFEVGSQNGEIRTIRQVTDKDAVKQRLTVIVEDNGQPSRSATVIVNVAVADSFPEVLSEFTDFTHDKEYNDNLTFYLVLALAVVSFLFITCLVVIISVKIYRWRQSRILYHSNLPVIPYYPPRYSDTLGTGTLQHVYNYEVCRTTDSRKSDCGQIRYSIPEEMRKGSVIGNVAQDLGLDLKRLRSGRARIVTGENIHYTELKADKGILVVNERIDREELCGDVTPCSFSFEVLYPVQTGGSLVAEMVPRSADVGYLVTKVVAVDVDSGQNAWLSYKLQKATDRALFEVGSQNGEIRTIRQVTDKDAVKQRLTVIVEDNGQPSRSATVIVNVAVADSFPEVLSEFTDFTHDKEYNDNLTFYLVLALAVVSFLFITCLVVIISVKIYSGHIRYSIPEEMKKGSLIGNVAQDLGLDLKRLRSGRARIVTGENIQYTELKADKGILVVNERIDREQLCGDVTPCSFSFEVILENPMELHQITVEITDINDHSPSFKRNRIHFEISETANIGARFPLASAEDPDVGVNGLREYFLTENDNFILKQNSNADGKKYAEMVLQKPLDRETNPNLSLKLIAVDGGTPQRSENNSPGVSLLTVSAKDPDENQNARISYILEDTKLGGSPVSEYVSINAESGVIHADQNDNPPQVLYPVQTGGSLVAEMVPRSADVGYLVTKVVAVDVDSGQNAWLSYKLQKATDRALFEVGSQNGEIRTIRQVTDKDAVKQRLTVIVEDNGQPSRSATVIVNVAVADSFPEVLSEFTDFTHDKEYNDNLTFYLVLALAVVSFLFITCLVVIISVKIYRWRQSRILYHSNLPVIPYYPPRYSDTLGTGTLQHVYNYEVCRTTDS